MGKMNYRRLLIAFIFGSIGFIIGCAKGGGKVGEFSNLVPVLSQDIAKFTSAEECRTCHSVKYAEWRETHHSEALDALEEIGFAEEGECLSCHTVGYNAGGFKSLAETPMFAGVQCESCHGSGVNHAGRVEFIQLSYSSEVCATCHSWELSPIYQEWKDSHHGEDIKNLTDLPFFRNDCLSCHSAEYILAEQGEKPTKFEVSTGITCVACHDPHVETENGAHLRYAKAELCVTCHMNSDSAPNDKSERYPHPHQTQGNIYFGEGGYPLTEVRNSAHSNADEFPNACLECHQSEAQINPEIPHEYATHTFEPNIPSACVRCHGDSVVPQLANTQNEIQERLDALSIYFDEESPNFIDPESLSDEDFINYNRALFNFDMVDADGSLGVHNGRYVRALLDAAEYYISQIQD